MTHENPHDKPVDRQAVVEAYSAEMVAARDDLAAALQDAKQRAEAADAAGVLPPRVRVRQFSDGPATVTTLDLGAYPDDAFEALAQFRTDKALGSLALGMGLTGPETTGADLMVVTYRRGQLAVDPGLPVVEQPMVKVEWSKRHGDERVDNTLAIYDDGYVESTAGLTRTEYRHPEEASDFARQFAQPRVAHEVELEPALPRPAGVSDVANARNAVAQTQARFGFIS